MIEIDNRWQLYEQGISVPSDISVAGFNDTSMCTLFSPSLISVRQDVALRARIALDALHRLNENKEMETTTMLPFTLVK
ncbi:MAG: LacI family transcriptional regulator [Lachnospiraceae bacterium]|nr:LacI family transcriptional regulator [Lachnospiraceae bacterium]